MRVRATIRTIDSGNIHDEVFDLLPGQLAQDKIDEYNRLISYNKIFVERTANVGVLPAEVAVIFCSAIARLTRASRSSRIAFW